MDDRRGRGPDDQVLHRHGDDSGRRGRGDPPVFTASHQAQVGPGLLGFGAPLAGCFNCATLTRDYNYGLGVVLTGSWILQNPLFAGSGAIEAYLPSRRIAVAVATTFTEQSYDEQGNLKHGNASQNVFAEIGAYLAPEDAPPQPTGRVD